MRTKGQSDDQLDLNYLHAFDETVDQVDRYFPLYDMNRYRVSLAAGRDLFANLPLHTESDKSELGKDTTLQNVFMGLHANSTIKSLKNIGIKSPLGLLQKTSGIFLTADAEVVYQSPTGLFERVVRLRDL